MKLNENFRESSEKQSPENFFTKLSRVKVFAALSALTLILSAVPEKANAGSDKLPYCKDIRGYHPDNVYVNEGESGMVYCVVDADTFDIRLDRNGQIIRVRLWGVDCPESSMNKKCKKQSCDPSKGKKVSEMARKVLKGKKVRLKGPFRKNGERKLSYVELMDNGSDFGENLVKSCMCEEVHGGPYSHKREDEYKRSARQCR